MKNVQNLYYFCIYFKKRPKNDLVLFRFVLYTPQGLKTYQSCRRSLQVNSFRVLADSVVCMRLKLGRIKLQTRPDTRQSSREQLGKSSNATSSATLHALKHTQTNATAALKMRIFSLFN